MSTLSLQSGSFDWTEKVKWHEGAFRLTFRDIGVVAQFQMDVSDHLSIAPQETDTFVLSMPDGSRFVLYPTGVPTLPTYGSDGTDKAIEYVYECVCAVGHLDYVGLPEIEFFDSTSGEIARTLIAAMDPSLDTSQIATGNPVPYLDTREFAKFSDVMRSEAVASGNYILAIDPRTGASVIGQYRTDFGASGITVDKDSADFSPMDRDRITPNNDIINRQKVIGAAAGGPVNTVCEARELDALSSSFVLKRKPYGIEDTELLRVEFGDSSANQESADALPKVVPLHYPAIVSVNDITPAGGLAEICGFSGRGGRTLLSCIAGQGAIGAVVNDQSYTVALPLAAGAQAADGDHQYRYDWVAQFTGSGLKIIITEHYFDNTSDEVVLATVTSVDPATRQIFVSGDATLLPSTIRVFAAGDPDDVIAIVNVTERGSNYVIVDRLPSIEEDGAEIEPGMEIAHGDAAVVIDTTAEINAPAPTGIFGKPRLSAAAAAGARSWAVSYGPAISGMLLADPARGIAARPLRFDTAGSPGADIVVQAQGSGAVATLVKDRLPARGPIKLILNYDAAKQASYTAKDDASIAEFGVRNGAIITNEYAKTEADCQAIAEAVIADSAWPSPRGTLKRLWSECPVFPIPGMSVGLKLPAEYRLTQNSTVITEVSVDFSGYDSWDEHPIVLYHVAIGEPSRQALVERDLLTREQSYGTAYRPVTISGPRISGFTWNDTDLVTLSVSGGVQIGGRSVGASFDPAAFASGNLRETPVKIAGNIDGKHELLVEVIYPPEAVDPAGVTSSYRPNSNTILVRWGDPPGAISFPIEKQEDTDLDPATAAVRVKFDEVFSPAVELPYDPLSKKIWIQTVGLADKTPGDPVEVTVQLPKLPAPNPFQILKVKANNKIILAIGPPPQERKYKGRVESVVIYTRRQDAGQPPPPAAEADWRNFFDQQNPDCDAWIFAIKDQTRLAHYRIEFDDTDADDEFWIMAAFRDRFKDDGDYTTPFDATRPPMEVGTVDPANFFQSAPKAQGGTVEDDNELDAGIQFSGMFRYNLGRHNESVKFFFEESLPMKKATDTPQWSGRYVHEGEPIDDQDIANGTADILFKQKFSYGKKNYYAYRLTKVIVWGVVVRERIGPDGEENATIEKKYLVGVNGTSFPAVVPNEADGYFNMNDFTFIPGVAGLANNFDVVQNLRKLDAADAFENGLKFRWAPIDDPGLSHYLFLISTQPFGTRGPLNDPAFDAALDAVQGEGALYAYDPTNTTRNVLVYAEEVIGTRHRLHNGDVYEANYTAGVSEIPSNTPDITIQQSNTYYAAVIARKLVGRWSSALSTVINTISGDPVDGGDADINDAARCAAVGNLTSVWKEGRKGWIVRFDPPTALDGMPTVQPTTIQYYKMVIWNDTGGTLTYLNVLTGAAYPAGTTEAAATLKINETSYPTLLGNKDLPAVFKAGGTNKVKVLAVNRVAGAETDGVASTATLVAIGSDQVFGAPSVAPKVPVAADVVVNQVDIDTTVADAKIGIKVDTATGVSFATAHVTAVTAILREPSAGQKYPLHAVIDDSSLNTATCYGNVPLGKVLELVKVTFWNGEESVSSVPASTLTIKSGRLRLPTTAAEVTFASAPTMGTPIQRDNKHAIIPVTITQNAQPGSLLDGGPIFIKKLILKHKWTSESTYVKADALAAAAEEQLMLPGAHTVEFTVKHKPAQTYDYQLVVICPGDVSQTFNLTTQVNTSADSTGGAPAPSTTPSNPSNASLYFPENQLQGDWTSGLAKITLRIETANGLTFAANNISEAYAHIRQTGVVSEKTRKIGGPITDTSKTFIEVQDTVEAGVQFDWVKNTFHNAETITQSAGAAVSFWGGRYKYPTSSAEIPTPQIVGFTQKNNKKAIVTVRVFQRTLGVWDNANPLSILKKVVLRQDEGDGNGFQQEGESVVNKEEALLANGGSVDVPFTVQHKDGSSRAYIAQVKGGGSSAVFSSNSSTHNQGTTGTFLDAPTDSVAPGTPTITANVAGSRWHFFATMPSTGANTRLEYRFVMMRASSQAALGNPDSNPGGVVISKTTNAGHTSFRIGRVASSVDGQYYAVFCAVRNVTVSSWSPWGQFNLGVRSGMGFTRELEDENGSGIPTIDTGVGILGWANFAADGTLSGSRLNTAIKMTYIQNPDTSFTWYIEFLLKPFDPNYYALRSIEYKIWKASGKLRRDEAMPITSKNVVVLESIGYTPVVQWRCQNKYLDNGSSPNGFSSWSFYASGADGTLVSEGGIIPQDYTGGGIVQYPDKGVA